jgi:hypothetical protein
MSLFLKAKRLLFSLLLVLFLIPSFDLVAAEAPSALRPTRAGLPAFDHTALFDGVGAAPVEGMISNSLTQMVWNLNGTDTLLWGANSFGVLQSSDFGASFVTHTDSSGLGSGGVSGLAANDFLVAVATVMDTSIADVQGAGTGLAFTQDFGGSWTFLEQPMDCFFEASSGNPVDRIARDCVTGDSLDHLIATPVTTTIENITWGLAVEGDSALWAASFAGGFRRYDIRQQRWDIQVPDNDYFDPVTHLNHRAFSLLATEAGIWAGSAAGVNFLAWDSLRVQDRSQRGEGWKHFDYQHKQPNGDPPITGNWVVTMGLQERTDGAEAVWVSGWATFASVGDYYGLSWTADQGETWTLVEDMRGKKIWDFAFDGDLVYAATSEGLWKSNQNGADGSWSRFAPLRDAWTGREMLNDEVFSVQVLGGRLLVGGRRGLFVSVDDGNHWASTHHTPSTHIFFPNPFSPESHLRATIAVNPAEAGSVTVTIYDFAMDLVKEVVQGAFAPAAQSTEFYWDGTNRQGNRVANGVYFYQISGPGISSWGKLMVIR